MKKKITEKKEIACIYIPSIFFKKNNCNYRNIKLSFMLYIYLALGKNVLCKQPFIFNDFIKWYSPKRTSRGGYTTKIKKETQKLLKDFENEKLIKIVESYISYCKIELTENFYLFDKLHTFKSFVRIYIDEWECISDGEYDEITRNMLLYVFLYLRYWVGYKGGCYTKYIGSLAKELHINKNTLSKILRVLNELGLIYSKIPNAEWLSERENFYRDKTIFTNYYKRDFKNKVEIYGDDYIEDCIRQHEEN